MSFYSISGLVSRDKSYNHLTVNAETVTGITINGTTVNATTVNATDVNSTDVTATGTVSGSTISGTTVNATTVNATDVNSTDVTATGTVSGGTISGTTGNITTVNATTVNATDVNSTDVTATGTVSGSTISGTTVNATTVNATDVNSTDVTATGTVSGGTISGTTGNITTVNATTVNSTDVTATGTVSGGTVSGTTGNITTVNATDVNSTDVTATGTVSGSTISGTTVNATTVNATDVNSTDVTATGTVSGTTGNFDVVNTLQVFDSSNVKYYGAVGDGVTDDTAAFNAALAAVNVVYVPQGDYIVSSTINVPSSVKLYGNNYNSKILSDQDVIVSIGDTTEVSQIVLAYTGSNVLTSVGIDIVGTDQSTIKNVIVSGPVNNVAYGVRLRGSGIDSPLSNTIIDSEINAGVSSLLLDGTAAGVIMTDVINCKLNVLTAAGSADVVSCVNATNSLFQDNQLSSTAGVTTGYNFDAASMDNTVLNGNFDNISNILVEVIANNNYLWGVLATR
jgi:hypothetical protein